MISKDLISQKLNFELKESLANSPNPSTIEELGDLYPDLLQSWKDLMTTSTNIKTSNQGIQTDKTQSINQDIIQEHQSEKAVWVSKETALLSQLTAANSNSDKFKEKLKVIIKIFIYYLGPKDRNIKNEKAAYERKGRNVGQFLEGKGRNAT